MCARQSEMGGHQFRKQLYQCIGVEAVPRCRGCSQDPCEASWDLGESDTDVPHSQYVLTIDPPGEQIVRLTEDFPLGRPQSDSWAARRFEASGLVVGKVHPIRN